MKCELGVDVADRDGAPSALARVITTSFEAEPRAPGRLRRGHEVGHASRIENRERAPERRHRDGQPTWASIEQGEELLPRDGRRAPRVAKRRIRKRSLLLLKGQD